MTYLFLLLSFLFVAQPGDPGNELSISATGEVELPADQIQFQITVNAEADQPQEAYRLHQEREEALVDLLDTYAVSEEDIQYEPISITKIRSYNRSSDSETPSYQTRQTVRLMLDDFSVYEKIQVGLIEAGYDDFSGAFMSSQRAAGEDRALEKAIEAARQKAELIAQTTGVQLGAVKSISYSFSSSPQPLQSARMSVKAESDSSLLKYEQTLSVSAQISITYHISSEG